MKLNINEKLKLRIINNYALEILDGDTNYNFLKGDVIVTLNIDKIEVIKEKVY
jgi:hypothetical protein